MWRDVSPARMFYLGKAQRDATMQDPTDKGKVLNRTWTISSHPSEQTSEKAFSISVKQVGLISGWLHTSFSKGGVLEWRGVEGAFTPQEHAGPALLIAGGIGEPLPSAAAVLHPHCTAEGASTLPSQLCHTC